jgi:Lon protease-like protein
VNLGHGGVVKKVLFAHAPVFPLLLDAQGRVFAVADELCSALHRFDAAVSHATNLRLLSASAPRLSAKPICGGVAVADNDETLVELAMFPLGSVLFPHMPLALRVFEQRYLDMLAQILKNEPPEFGVVLIERGNEVGGGEKRYSHGTVAQIRELDGAEGFVAVGAEGADRFEVVEWLEDDPYPRALVRPLPTLEFTDDLAPARERAERIVRRTLAVASEFADQLYSSAVQLSDDPVEAAWQLAAIAPLGSFDQEQLLRSDSLQSLLEGIIDHTVAAEEVVRMSMDFEDEPDSD